VVSVYIAEDVPWRFDNVWWLRSFTSILHTFAINSDGSWHVHDDIRDWVILGTRPGSMFSTIDWSESDMSVRKVE
jgi:hypothetical protein